MIRPIDIRLNAAHPDLPLAEAVTYTGAPSTVLIRGVPGNCGRWAITAVFVAATFPDGSTSTRTAVQSANGVWVATLPATATSGRTAHGLRILADGADENGEAVGGYVLGVADFAVASLAVTPAPEPGETSWQMLYFDAVPSTLRKGDVTKVDGVLKLYNGTAWEAFANVPAPSTANPAMDGTAAPGTSAAYAHGDHVHPTDTSRMAASATGEDIPAYEGSSQSVWNAISSAGSDAAQAVTKADAAVNTANGVAGALTQHADDTTIHVTAAEKSTWNGKQDALTAQQLANIAAVSAALAFDATHSYAVGDPVVYNGTLYTFTAAHTGAWTGSDVSAVDIIARLAGKLDKSGVFWTVSYTDYGLHIADNAGAFYIDIAPNCVRTNFPDAVHEFYWPINGGTLALLENLAGNFSLSTTYAKDVLVVYSGALYRCINPNGHTGAWVDADFTTATVEDILAVLRAGKANRATNPTAGNLASLDSQGNPTDSGVTAGDLARYSLTTKTIDNGAVTLDDRAMNAVAVSSALASLTINFPTATSGAVRDFGLRLSVASGITTAPELVLPQGITCENADGEVPEIGADGAATILYFTETAAGVFLVKGEVVQTIS